MSALAPGTPPLLSDDFNTEVESESFLRTFWIAGGVLLLAAALATVAGVPGDIRLAVLLLGLGCFILIGAAYGPACMSFTLVIPLGITFVVSLVGIGIASLFSDLSPNQWIVPFVAFAGAVAGLAGTFLFDWFREHYRARFKPDTWP